MERFHFNNFYYFIFYIMKHNSRFEAKTIDRWYHPVFDSAVTLPFEPIMYTRMATMMKPLASRERHNTAWNWAIKANFRRVCAGENLQVFSKDYSAMHNNMYACKMFYAL